MKTVRSKFVALCLATLTLALLACVAWKWSANSATSAVTAAVPNTREVTANPSVAAHELAPLAAPGESPRNEAPAVRVTPNPSVAPGRIDESHLATVVLKGTIQADRDDLQLAQVTVRASWTGDMAESRYFADMDRDFGPGGNVPVMASKFEMHAKSGGSFEFDVTPLIQIPATDQLARGLFVIVTHPKLATVTELVKLGPVERLRREARVELTIVVHMPQSIVTLLGQAWTIDGVPVKTQVAALARAATTDLQPFGPAVDVRADSSFSFSVAAPAEYSIVAVAEGYRPCALRVKLEPGDDVTLPPLVLDHGQSIRGRVRLASKTSLAGTTIAAQPAGSFTRTQVAGKNLACFDDAFEWATRSARADANGEYELSALGPRAYSVSTSSVPGAYLGRVTAHDFVAPCTGADLTLGGVCEVHVTFNGEGKPSSTRFGVRQQHGAGATSFGAQESASDGQVTLFIEPGATTSIVLPGSDGEREFTVPACAAGRVMEMRIDL